MRQRDPDFDVKAWLKENPAQKDNLPSFGAFTVTLKAKKKVTEVERVKKQVEAISKVHSPGRRAIISKKKVAPMSPQYQPEDVLDTDIC